MGVSVVELGFWVGLKPPVLGLEPLGRDSSAGQSQLPLAQGLSPLGRSYKMMCGSLQFVLGLEVLGGGYTVN